MVHSTENSEGAADPAESDASERPSGWVVATGLNAAIAVSYLACKPPQGHTLSLTARLSMSAIYILVTCLAGAVATWIVLSYDSRKQLPSLLLLQAHAWIFLPAIMMFLREGSGWAPALSILSAALMAAYFTRSFGSLTKPHPEVEKDIFITQLRLDPISRISFGVSLCLYGAFLSAVNGELELLTLLLGASAFLLVAQIPAAQSTDPSTARREENKNRRTPSYRWLAIAFFCAFLALSASSGTSDHVWRLRAFHVLEHAVAKPRTKPAAEGRSAGYQVIVLWPIEKKEKVIQPPPSSVHPSTHISKPWAIPFDGPYWYFKVHGESPGPKANIAHGDPLQVNVRSTDSDPLLMEAHQTLPIPIKLNCCREIQVVFKNDLSLGATDVGLSLTDSHAPGKPSQNLGIKYVPSDDIDSLPGSTSPVEKTVSFPLPKPAKIRKFDQITVTLLPDARHQTAGRKVAVERFIMIPN